MTCILNGGDDGVLCHRRTLRDALILDGSRLRLDSSGRFEVANVGDCRIISACREVRQRWGSLAAARHEVLQLWEVLLPLVMR